MPAPETHSVETDPASQSRPAQHTVLRSFAGHLEAAPQDVFAALVQRMTGAPGVTVHANANAHEIVQHSGRWYRGEYRVMPEANDAGADTAVDVDVDADTDTDAATPASGTRLEFEIVNVAQRWHRLAEFSGRAVLADAPYGFHALLSDVEAELDPDGANRASDHDAEKAPDSGPHTD